jgi:hypothetical protein
MNTRLVDRYVRKLQRRGRAIAQQTAAIVTLIQKSPADLSSVLGPVLLISQGVARGQVEVLSWVMSDSEFPAQNLDFQGYVAIQTMLWTDLWAALANVSFGARLPSIDSLVAGPPGASAFTPNQRGVAIGVALESLASPAVASGITVAKFWNRTDAGTEALGRLLAMDVMLTRTYDFAPLDEAITVMDELVPIVPDAVALIRAVEATSPGLQEPAATSASAQTVTKGMDLAGLAMIVLGSADLWRSIAAYNSLRYPYISDDPLDQYGDAQGVSMLADTLGSGGETLVLDDALLASILYPDQRILLDDGAGHQELVTVTQLATGASVPITSPNQTYPAGSTVTVYPPTYEVTGRVLRTGDIVMVPVQQSSGTSGVVVLRQAGGDADKLYGTDVEVSAVGRLTITSEGDLAVVSGVPNLSQALRNRYQTEKGSLPYHPQYGFGLEAYLGFRHNSFFNFLAVVEGKQTALRDPRIAKVEDFSAVVEADAITLKFNVVTKSDQQFPASIVTPVRG